MATASLSTHEISVHRSGIHRSDGAETPRRRILARPEPGGAPPIRVLLRLEGPGDLQFRSTPVDNPPRATRRTPTPVGGQARPVRTTTRP